MGLRYLFERIFGRARKVSPPAAPPPEQATPGNGVADTPRDLTADEAGNAETAPAIEAEPAISAGPPNGRERRKAERHQAAEGVRVLVVDDSPTIVVMLRRMLVQNGYEVSEAGDAETGLEIARNTLPHLIFLDIVLPGMNGFEALRRLRRDPLTRGIPVIMISGNELATEQFYAQRIGADDFMKKPFSRYEVFLRIESLLDPERIPHRPAMVAAPAAMPDTPADPAA